MKKALFIILCFCAMITACNNQSSNGNGEKKETSKADSLMNDVDEAHAQGMARQSKIRTAKKMVQTALDSINKLPAKAQQAAMPYKIKLDSALARLNFSDYSMDKWMEEFSVDSALNNAEQRIEYLSKEKLKISKIKDIMQSSLQKADSLLKKTF